MSDKVSKEIRSKNMAAIHNKGTKLEEMVSKKLWTLGFRFRKNVSGLLGKPDIVIKKYKIVIFIDSCFWHGCTIHAKIPTTNESFWRDKINKNRMRDMEVTDYYQRNGWNILRVWEHEIYKDFDITMEKIKTFIWHAKRL